MEKIKFDIKYRPEIESGDMEVVTRDGRSVKILMWDARHPIFNLVGTITTDETEEPFSWTRSGLSCRFGNFEMPSDLFLVKRYEELTPFEEAVKNLSNTVLLRTPECIKQKANELLEIAFAEFKEAEASHMKDWYDTKFAEAKEQGRAEAMKLLPKWRKIKCGERLPCPAYLWSSMFDRFPGHWEGRLFPNMEGVKVGSDNWYLPASVIHDLPKEGEE